MILKNNEYMTFIPVISVTPYLYAWYLWREFAFSAKTLYVYRELHWYLYFEYYVFTHLTYAKKERNGILIASHDLFGFFYFFISSVFFSLCVLSFFFPLVVLVVVTLLCHLGWHWLCLYYMVVVGLLRAQNKRKRNWYNACVGIWFFVHKMLLCA